MSRSQVPRNGKNLLMVTGKRHFLCPEVLLVNSCVNHILRADELIGVGQYIHRFATESRQDDSARPIVISGPVHARMADKIEREGRFSTDGGFILGI